MTLIEAYQEKLGAKQFDLLIDWGWFYFITKPLFKLLHWLSQVLGNYGLAILATTVLVKAAFFPLANKSYELMAKMKKLQPEMEKIRDRFKDDRVKQQQELMALYKNEKINPASGCLPIVLQIPVFFALYKVLFITIDMRHAPFFGWIKDLSAPDPTSIFNLFGLLPYQVPEFLMVGVWPLIMGVTMWVQMQLNPQQPDPMQQRIFNWMPVIFTFMLASFPSGLVIYWAWNNVLSLIQQYAIMRKNNTEVHLWKNLGVGQVAGADGVGQGRRHRQGGQRGQGQGAARRRFLQPAAIAGQGSQARSQGGWWRRAEAHARRRRGGHDPRAGAAHAGAARRRQRGRDRCRPGQAVQAPDRPQRLRSRHRRPDRCRARYPARQGRLVRWATPSRKSPDVRREGQDNNPMPAHLSRRTSSQPGRRCSARAWQFVKSAPSLQFLPPADRPELAFAGRSNVGKSSLINALVSRRGLARTSNTPGRTQELNYLRDAGRGALPRRHAGLRLRQGAEEQGRGVDPAGEGLSARAADAAARVPAHRRAPRA